MKINNYLFSSIEELEIKLNLELMNPIKTLIQVFTGLIEENDIKKICSIIKNKNQDIQFIGSTTAGEIIDGKVKENSIVVSIMSFENTSCEIGYFIDEDDYKLGVSIAQSLFKENTKASILFIDGLKTNGNDVVDGIASINNTIPIAGGMAGDNGNFINTFVFSNKGVYDKGAVVATLNSDVLNVITDYQLNWQAIGQEMVVTKAEKNRLYEIDGISANEIYKKYLGDKVGDNLPFSATEFPLLKIDDTGLEICRTFVHQFDEDGSLLTIGNLEVGDKVKLAFGNVDLVLNSTKNNINNYKNFKPEAIFAYNCTARRAFLQSEINIELSPLHDIAPMSGFFTYGEIFHKECKNSLLNVSLTILGLSEKQKIKEVEKEIILNDEQKKNFITNKHFLVLDALTHLSNTVIKEMEEAKQEIEIMHKHTRDSIEYASLIQNSLIPDNELFKKYFKDFFAIWNPKDIVGWNDPKKVDKN